MDGPQRIFTIAESLPGWEIWPRVRQMVPSGTVAGERAGRESKLLQQTIVFVFGVKSHRSARIQEKDFTVLSFDLCHKANDLPASS